MRKKLVQATALAMSWCMIGGTVLTCSAQEQENIEVSDNFNAEGLPILCSSTDQLFKECS